MVFILSTWTKVYDKEIFELVNTQKPRMNASE